MQLFIDLGTNSFITDPLFKAPYGDISFKRGDSSTINVSFVSGNTPLSAVGGKTIKFGIKQAGDYDGSYLVYTNTYTINDVNYVLKPSFNTTTLNNLLSGDTPSVAGMLEITWSDNGTDEFSTNTQAVTINNDVNKIGEAPPYIIPEPVQWVAENVIGLGTSPFDIRLKENGMVNGGYISYMPNILIQESTFVYTSDGSNVIPATGLWVKLFFDNEESQWTLHLYEDYLHVGTWLDQGTSPSFNLNNATFLNTLGSYGDLYVVVGKDSILNKHRFVTDFTTLFVNIGPALSGVQEEDVLWKTIQLGDLI